MIFLSSDTVEQKKQRISGLVLSTCTSTMDAAWELFEAGSFAEWDWVRAEQQSCGRGSFGRKWISDKGNLMVSLRLPDETGKMDSFLSPALALCIVRALDSLDICAAIKWPNDIMLGSEKLGGILIENRKNIIVAGIGLNIASAPYNSPEEDFFRIPASSLKNINIDISPSALWALLLNAIISDMSRIMLNQEKAAEEIEKFLAFKDDIVILQNTGICDGPARIKGINSKGSLRVQTSTGEFFIDSSQINLNAVPSGLREE